MIWNKVAVLSLLINKMDNYCMPKNTSLVDQIGRSIHERPLVFFSQNRQTKHAQEKDQSKFIIPVPTLELY